MNLSIFFYSKYSFIFNTLKVLTKVVFLVIQNLKKSESDMYKYIYIWVTTSLQWLIYFKSIFLMRFWSNLKYKYFQQ